MHSLDTNVLVRYLIADEPAQFQSARTHILQEASSGDPPLITLLVLLETEWVLRSRYRRSKAEIEQIFDGLLSSTNVQVEDESSVETAVHRWHRGKGDFADYLIAARSRALGCSKTVTFDRIAGSESDFLTLQMTH